MSADRYTRSREAPRCRDTRHCCSMPPFVGGRCPEPRAAQAYGWRAQLRQRLRGLPSAGRSGRPALRGLLLDRRWTRRAGGAARRCGTSMPSMSTTCEASTAPLPMRPVSRLRRCSSTPMKPPRSRPRILPAPAISGTRSACSCPTASWPTTRRSTAGVGEGGRLNTDAWGLDPGLHVFWNTDGATPVEIDDFVVLETGERISETWDCVRNSIEIPVFVVGFETGALGAGPAPPRSFGQSGPDRGTRWRRARLEPRCRGRRNSSCSRRCRWCLRARRRECPSIASLSGAAVAHSLGT